MLKNTLLPFLFGALITLSGVASAENSQDFGDYVVHFNALNTNYLPPSVTREYGLKRSKNRGMVNVAVLRKVMGTAGKPVAAKITASATNLAGQKRDIALREVREGNAIYYIGDFPISHEETLRFTLHVKPGDNADANEVKFIHQFFTE
ncbi:uncharacterized protein DUF4426 [Thiogranum longum]|uniref:Uncharacterized protein DUF4426 n=1 Tax=Thiogranum longum TaxID=1537524 RepID=A0A4V2PGJ8_9GAMM|nr:DUF4426 domain-containing protein [Thiogranum longum]TCK17126.1 uncharacterized protein DUF4426 [Thiogranum longum]